MALNFGLDHFTASLWVRTQASLTKSNSKEVQAAVGGVYQIISQAHRLN